MKNLQVQIKDKNTLELLQEGNVGDKIILNEISNIQIDRSFIEDLINKHKDEIYSQRLEITKNDAKKHGARDKELELTKTQIIPLKNQIETLNQQIQQLNSEIKNKDISFNDKLKLETNKIIQAKEEQEIKPLEQKIVQLRHNYDLEIQKLKDELKNKDNFFNDKLELEKTKIINIESKKYHELENKLINLQREKSELNVKKHGEELEKWCINEYETHYSSQESWEFKKDNELGQKGDFIFKVFDKTGDKTELTSIMFEAKSELPNSTNRKKNEDFYKKLDNDRKARKCEYAILISELEMDLNNYVPIKVVPTYEKMYMVRPQYFLSLLSIIAALSIKTKQLNLELETQKLKTKDKKEFEEELEELKKSILEVTISRIEKNIGDIQKHASGIKALANNIEEKINLISHSITSTIKNKIQDLTIRKISKNNKIDINQVFDQVSNDFDKNQLENQIL